MFSMVVVSALLPAKLGAKLGFMGFFTPLRLLLFVAANSAHHGEQKSIFERRVKFTLHTTVEILLNYYAKRSRYHWAPVAQYKPAFSSVLSLVERCHSLLRHEN